MLGWKEGKGMEGGGAEVEERRKEGVFLWEEDGGVEGEGVNMEEGQKEGISECKEGG